MMFERWCILNGHQPFGAAPAIVAQFVNDIAPMGIEQVWKAVQDVARMHSAHGLPDPTVNPCVAAAINEIAKIDPPRSWPDEEKRRFLTLPYDIQAWLSKRQAIDDALIRKIQRQLADCCNYIMKEHTDETDTDQAASLRAEIDAIIDEIVEKDVGLGILRQVLRNDLTRHSNCTCAIYNYMLSGEGRI